MRLSVITGLIVASVSLATDWPSNSQCMAGLNSSDSGGVQAQLWPIVSDVRHGVVATNTSGWGGPFVPMQGPQFFDALGMRWWYNYVSDSDPDKVFTEYHKLYMYWRATLGRSAEQIQADAAAAAAAYPGQTIWWAMSNEPNDYGQANQSATEFAGIYYHYHSNLKAGDPNCMIMGPGILNWDFLSTSVWQRGKDWYEEFRQAWYNDPTFRGYGETNYGVSYPPQDAFNLHTYDLRGVQGTPWEPEDWRYSRDQILMCYNDILTYPEVLNKKIWLTEFAALRAATMADNIVLTRQLVGWMRDQPFMDRWVWFTIHSDLYWSDTDPPRLELLTETGEPTAVGESARELASLPLEVKVDPVNGHYAGDPIVPYLRAGATTAANITDVVGDHPRFELAQGGEMTAGSMRGRTITAGPDRLIRKVLFQFNANYDDSLVRLVMDQITTSGRQEQVWENDQYGSRSGDAILIFNTTDRVQSIGTGLIVLDAFIYGFPTGQWYGEIRNLVIYTEPDRGLVAPDFDLDSDVDLEDFGHFQVCLTGPSGPIADQNCLNADLDGDSNVDQNDLTIFLGCISSADIPANPDCAE